MPLKKIKILVNALSARNGGGVTYLRNIFANIPDALNVKIIIFVDQGFGFEIQDHRVQVVKVSFWKSAYIFRWFWSRSVFRKIVEKEKPEVVFYPGGVIDFDLPHGVKVVTMFRNMLPFDKSMLRQLALGKRRLRYFFLRRLMLKSMSQADLTIFISDYCRQFILDKIKIKESIVIYHGVNDEFRVSGKNLQRPLDVPDGKYILYVSRFDVHKNHEKLILAFSNISDELKNQFSLVLVGEKNSKSYTDSMKLIKSKGLEDLVYPIGPVSYSLLPRYYANAEAIVFASSCENCPNILLESLASGKPVLSSNIMPMPEFGGTGIGYFSPYDVDSITRALEDLAFNKKNAESNAASALIKSKDYDWALTSKKTWETLHAVGVKNFDG